MNPKAFVHNTAYSVQLTYIAGLSLFKKCFYFVFLFRFSVIMALIVLFIKKNNKV